jgi:hypothetical protein
MKITMNDPIRNVDGTEIKNGDTAVLFVDIIITALTATVESDKNEEGKEMLKKWDLAERAQKARGDVMEITTDEASFIKERIRKVYASTIMYANAHRLLEAAAGNN